MSLPKIEEARSLNDEQLNDEILATKKQLFDLRLQQATRRLEKPHQFRHLRHRLAQLLTVERERQIEQAKAQAAAAQPEPAPTPAVSEEVEQPVATAAATSSGSDASSETEASET
jgi:large subunit ribosomal protein L29